MPPSWRGLGTLQPSAAGEGRPECLWQEEGESFARGTPKPSRPGYQNKVPRPSPRAGHQSQGGGRGRGGPQASQSQRRPGTSGRLGPRSPLPRRPAATPPRPGGGSRVLGRPMGRADGVQLGVASRLAAAPQTPPPGGAAPLDFADRGAGVRVATQPSVTAGEGQPHGQLRRKARAPTPGVDPHLLLINCGGLLPRLVTVPVPGTGVFRDPLWLRIFYCLSVACPTDSPLRPGGEEVGRRRKGQRS